MNTPKVRYQNKTWEVLNIAGKSIKITREGQTIIIRKDKVRPCNREARELFA